MNSLEGKRGWPRLKPPFPAIKGLFNAPTVVNNVETIMNIPDIVTRGGEWFAGLGVGKSGGTRIVCVSGHVNKPGVFELPMSITFRDLIYDVCGGIPGGRQLKGVIPGGSSMPPLDASEIDVPCEFDALMNDPRIKDVEVRPGVPFDLGGGRKLKTMAGSGGIVVFDDSTDVVALCARIMQFYAHESCGQCTPCREGSGWLARVCKRLARGQGEPGDVELLSNIANGIGGNTICALGDAAAWPMLGFLTKFRSDFEARIQPKKIGLPGGAVAPVPRGGSVNAGGASIGDQAAFWILAAFITFFAIFTMTRRNPVTAVMSLVATFFGLAAMYATLSAHFLAVLQVLVYAGAIMVLFIFVVMILNREEVAPLALRPLRILGVLAAVYLFVKFIDIVSVGVPAGAPAARGGRLRDGRRRRRHAVPGVPVPVRGDLRAAAGRDRRRRRHLALAPERGQRRTRGRAAQADRAHGQPRLPGAGPVRRRDRARGRPLAMPTNYYLILSFALFLIGTSGVLLRRNALIVLMGIELQLNGGNLALLAFARQLGDLKGHVLAFLIIALAAAEAAVGLATPRGPVPRAPDDQPRRNHPDEALRTRRELQPSPHPAAALPGRRDPDVVRPQVAARHRAGGRRGRHRLRGHGGFRRRLHRRCRRRARAV